MRTISTALQSVYDAPVNARSVYAKVEVNDGTSWFDLTDSYGRNWVESVQYSFAVTQDVGQCTVTLVRNHFGDSLSPLMTTSRFNLVGTLAQAGRALRVSTATMPLDVPPEAGDYVTVFLGYLDRVSVTDKVVLRARDYGGILQDRFIEETREYGDDGGSVQVEEVMQDILDDVDGVASFPVTINLYSPSGDDTALPGSAYDEGSEPTNWAIRRYEQQRQPVMTALKTLAGQIGFDLRYRWHENTSTFRLVMQEPDRSSPSVNHTLSAGTYRVMSVEQSREPVRNVVRVVFTDTGGNRVTRQDTDATSIAKYGRRFMEVSEESSSQIDTSAEADKLRNGILNELKEPTATVMIELPYFYVAELADYYTLAADGVFSDANVSLAVQSISHTIKAGQGVTQLGLVGVPSALERKAVEAQQTHLYRRWGVRNFPRSENPTGNQARNGSFSHWTRG